MKSYAFFGPAYIPEIEQMPERHEKLNSHIYAKGGEDHTFPGLERRLGLPAQPPGAFDPHLTRIRPRKRIIEYDGGCNHEPGKDADIE